MSLANLAAQADCLGSLAVFAGMALIILVVDRLFLRLALKDE